MLKKGLLNEEEQVVVEEPVIPEVSPLKTDQPLSGLGLLRQGLIKQEEEETVQDREEILTAQANKKIQTNSAVQEAALRFAKDHLGLKIYLQKMRWMSSWNISVSLTSMN